MGILIGQTSQHSQPCLALDTTVKNTWDLKEFVLIMGWIYQLNQEKMGELDETQMDSSYR